MINPPSIQSSPPHESASSATLTALGLLLYAAALGV
jgi:hypothetical protein